MEDIIEKFGWKKVAAVLILVSVAGLVYVAMSFNSIDSNSLKKAQKNEAVESNYEVRNDTDETSISKSALTFITPYYQISYPTSYTPTTQIPPDDALNSLVLTDSLNSSTITVTVFDSSIASIDKLSMAFEELKYTKRDIRIPGGNAIFYEGNIPPLIERVLLYEKAGKMIKVVLNYQGKANSTIDSTFTDIINSLQ